MRADFVIKNAWVFMTYRQCFEKRDVAVAGESFYCVSPAISYPGVNVGVHLDKDTTPIPR